MKLYNSLTKKKEVLTPISDNQVLIYCCGVTVYDYCHLGHARSYITWDVLRRYLKYMGYNVKYVQNFTDIDDKIINKARVENVSIDTITDRYVEAYFQDMEKLNIMPADIYPRATQVLDGIKSLITKLELEGYAYQSGGDVYYRTDKFEGYGKLSGRNVSNTEAPSISIKDSSSDFALWKSSKEGEPYWESPWGKGRPGWHIECSAMIKDTLGDSIDIHLGGTDLIFPHHENERAQSEAFTGKPLANYWLHNGMVTVSKEKMSKSLGNFTTIRDLLATTDANVIRLFILQANYHQSIDFTSEALSTTTNSWNVLKEALSFGYKHGSKLGWNLDRKDLDFSLIDKFQLAMSDDLNTPVALSKLFVIAKELNRVGNLLSHGEEVDIDSNKLYQQWFTYKELLEVLGFNTEDVDIESTNFSITDERLEELVQERLEAKQKGDYSRADAIRELLLTEGIKLIDKPKGETLVVREI